MATPSIKGTRTEQNLVQAFFAETASYARYTFYASQAEKELYYPVAEIFRDTAANELRHAKTFYKYLENFAVPQTGSSNPGIIGDTATNLQQSIEAEENEGVRDYTAAAAVAREEGFDDIASHFEAIASIEEHHRDRFARYLKMVQDGTVWKREKPVTWKCLVCGYQHVGTEPPTKCPACDHPYQHYMALDDDDII